MVPLGVYLELLAEVCVERGEAVLAAGISLGGYKVLYWGYILLKSLFMFEDIF